MENTDKPVSDNIKRIVVRSAAYPGYTIKKSIEFVTEIYRSNPSQNATFTLEGITGVIPSGALQREWAAAKEYGFLVKVESDSESDGYKISQLFKDIYAPIGNQYKESFLIAFKNPKLYKELLAKYDGFPLPKELPVILFKYHRISEAVAVKAADIFITNANDAGVLTVLNDEFVLKTASQIIVEAKVPEQLLNNLNNANTSTNPVDKKQETGTNVEGQIKNETEKANALALAEMNNAETEKVIIPGNRFIGVTYPKNLTQTDLKTFEKWYEYFKLRFGE